MGEMCPFHYEDQKRAMIALMHLKGMKKEVSQQLAIKKKEASLLALLSENDGAKADTIKIKMKAEEAALFRKIKSDEKKITSVPAFMMY
jgi:hypothetical protein